MNQKRRPSLEKVSPEFGTSFSVKHYSESSTHNKPPFWHFHPEIELVYVKGGSGKRHIGNHLSCYQSGDLVLIGSMLPHTGFTDRLTGNESETVIQFSQEFLGEDFFHLDEMQDIKKLFQRSKAGIAFYGEAKREIGQRLERLVKLDKFGKLIDLLCLLQYMAWTKEYKILNAEGYTMEVQKGDNDRINAIYSHVKKHFKRHISLEEIAELANMTVPSFCRYFKKISGKKFTQFVNEVRIVHACKLLVEGDDSISNIAFESGFNNFSHFNRQFKMITGQSPSAYRKQFVQVIHELSEV